MSPNTFITSRHGHLPHAVDAFTLKLLSSHSSFTFLLPSEIGLTGVSISIYGYNIHYKQMISSMLRLIPSNIRGA